MKQMFTATLAQEGAWIVAQCLEIDIASQGQSEDATLANFKVALEL